ncbi:aminotransferase class III-fold pyridoxal phosphate-dependent enzyme, partial [Algoriphagus sp.]|uniref:aminotransferase class III-fold pyridoxal phosphate-dependent enzyme n=1 Tax=Algoriphagus sp. TaxID=1872435 RepID=UPI0025D213A1
WMKDSEATSSEYWTQHMRLPVQFNSAVNNLLNELPEAAMVEVGPGKSLGTFLMQHEGAKNVAFVNSLNKTTSISEFEYFQQQVTSLVGQGLILNWDEIYDEVYQDKMLLPTYAFDKKRCWIDVKIDFVKENIEDSFDFENHGVEVVDSGDLAKNDSVKEIFESKVSQILKEACGVSVLVENFGLTYFEIGLDSLSMTQLAFSIKKEFKVDVSFLQLNNDLNTPQNLVEYLLVNSDLVKKISEPALKKITANKIVRENIIRREEKETIGKPVEADDSKYPALSEKAELFIKKLLQSYSAKTQKSKILIKKGSGSNIDSEKEFEIKDFLKDLNYPIVTKNCKGSQLIDLDGNKYLDWFSGSGSNLFGYQPDFINKAIIEQVQKGIDGKTQGSLIEIVSEKITRITKSEKVAFFDTSEEAKVGALDIAREVSQKSLFVIFSDKDSGARENESSSQKLINNILDQNETLQDLLILEYGTSESLEIIKNRSLEIAAVLVKPIQLNRLDFIPLDFLKELSGFSSENNICLIFDEVNTGFRSHIGGFQGLYSIKPDMTIYGNILGGGFSIGVLTGNEKWLGNKGVKNSKIDENAIVGIGKSYFANTLSRHPLTLTATNAILEILEEKGDGFQKRLASLSDKMVKGLNAIFEKYNVSYSAEQFNSIWKINSSEKSSTSEVVFALLRENGIHIWENLPCYVTDSHSESDVILTLGKVDEIVKSLVENDVIEGDLLLASENWMSIDNPPFEGAKISLNDEGFPIWVTPEEYKKSKSIILQSFFL